MPMSARKRSRRAVTFGSLFVCCLGFALVAAAFATQEWFTAVSENGLGDSGHVNFGIFRGRNYGGGVAPRTHSIWAVCLEGKCMYSCASTKEYRQEQLQRIINGESGTILTRNCEKLESKKSSIVDFLPHPALWWGSAFAPYQQQDGGVGEGALEELSAGLPEDSDTPTTTDSPAAVAPEDFMDYGLWVGTIICLSAGLLMAVVGALFAIVNTATTPVEAITGIPGLYLWNGLAALFDMLSVILWAVQFHQHLQNNVLLYEASDGWTTEGKGVFGYSFWLVVVAIFVHIANIAIIFIGTYERKAKQQLEAPETKGGNIMLY